MGVLWKTALHDLEGHHIKRRFQRTRGYSEAEQRHCDQFFIQVGSVQVCTKKRTHTGSQLKRRLMSLKRRIPRRHGNNLGNIWCLISPTARRLTSANTTQQFVKVTGAIGYRNVV